MPALLPIEQLLSSKPPRSTPSSTSAQFQLPPNTILFHAAGFCLPRPTTSCAALFCAETDSCHSFDSIVTDARRRIKTSVIDI